MKTIIKNPNWRRKRSTLKRCRSLKSLFAGLALLSLVSGFAAELQTAKFPKQTHICYTAECHATASAVLGKMNTQKDPCDDFYQYACGAFINKAHLTQGKTVVSTLLEISDKVHDQLKMVVIEPRSETDPKHLRLPNILYEACINSTLIDTLGAKPIKRIVKKLGGWPVTGCDCWNTNNLTWPETVKKFRSFGININYIVGFSIQTDPNNTNKRIINLDQCFLDFPRLYSATGFKEHMVWVYYDYMVDMAILFGADNKTARMELRKTLQFEIELAKISLPDEKRRDSKDLHNLRSIKQMQKSYPYVQWLDYINALLPDGLTVDENEVINVSVPSYFDKLGELLNRTEEHDIANYLMWRLHDYAADFLSKEFRKRKLEYLTKLWGWTKQEDCVKTVLQSLPILVDSLYVRKYFRQDSKAAVFEMVSNIRNAFSRMLDQTEWMDNYAIQKAKKKLNLMKNYIGYPDELLDDNKLKEYYRKLHIDHNKYFESSLRKNFFDIDESFNELRLPVNASNWKMYNRPAVVNAFYSMERNTIQLPAGILQGHLFNRDRQKYMNYGGIGSVIGHEVTHGFIDRGGEFDGYGDPLDWWQNNTRQAYKEKAECVINQYGNYSDIQSGLKVDGIKTQIENIADIGGIKPSYFAYNQWVAQNGEEQKLPGLNYTAQQMFWISSAQRLCAKSKVKKNWNNFDVYAPEEFRVLGPFSNMKEFSRDFQCTDGVRMNPVKKCDIW